MASLVPDRAVWLGPGLCPLLATSYHTNAARIVRPSVMSIRVLRHTVRLEGAEQLDQPFVVVVMTSYYKPNALTSWRRDIPCVDITCGSQWTPDRTPREGSWLYTVCIHDRSNNCCPFMYRGVKTTTSAEQSAGAQLMDSLIGLEVGEKMTGRY